MPRIIGILLLLICCTAAYPQTAFDSLAKAAETARKDSAAIAYNNLGQSIVYSNPVAAIPYFERGLHYAIKYGNYKQQCVSHSFLGTAHRHLGNYTEALVHFNQQLSVAIRHKEESEVTWAYINMGNIMVYMKNYSLSTMYLMDALAFAKRTNDHNAIPYIYVNLGRSALLSSNYDSALVWHNKALEIRKQHQETVNIAVTYRDIGNVYFARGWHSETKHYYRLCQNMIDTLPESDIPASININLAHIYLEENKIDSALHCATIGMRCASKFKNKSYIRDACTILGDIYLAIRNYRMAEKYYGLQILYNDSIRTSDISRKIFEIQTMNERYIMEGEIAQEDTMRTNMRTLSVVMLLTAAFGVGFAVILYLRRENVKSINKELDYQNTQLKDSIAYAQKIQEAVIPNFDKVGRIFSDRFMLFMPCELVSGDFYWYHCGDRYEVFAVADSGAQGVPGGCMSMLGSAILHEIAETEHIPALMLDRFRQRLISVLSDSRVGMVVDPQGMDMSLLAIDRQDHRLYFSGIKTPLVYVRGGRINLLQDNRTDESPKDKVFTTSELMLERGDRVYMMTPGFCAQNGGPGGNPFSRQRLYDLLGSISHKPMAEQMEILRLSHMEWVAECKRVEDVSIAGFEYL